MDNIVAALTWLLGGVFLFWVILAVLGIYAVVSVRDRSYFTAGGLLIIAVGCVMFRVDEFGMYVLSNPLMVVAWLAGYIGIGLLVSIGKWVYVVKDSKESLNQYREDFNKHQHMMSLSFDEYSAQYPNRRQYSSAYEFEDAKESKSKFESFEHYMASVYRDSKFNVKDFDGKKVIVLDTDKQPIPEWIIFWPFTLLSYVFEPLWSVVTRLAKRMGRLYDTISSKMLGV